LAGGWDAIGHWLPAADDLAQLERLHDELQSRLRLSLEATTSRRVLRAAVRDLLESMEMFNERWERYLEKVDLTPVNKARDDYNRYHLFEKECAVGSARVARMGYVKMIPATLDELASLFPPLAMSRFTI
jgi:hypothetical protein